MADQVLCKTCGEPFATEKVMQKVTEVMAEKGLTKYEQALNLCPSCRKKVFATELIGDTIQRVSGPKYIPHHRTEKIMSTRYDGRTGSTIYKSQCWSCNDGCDVWVYVKDGKVIKVEGDPSSPNTRGILCPKGLSAKYLLYHPDRLQYPLKRVGERGEGKWERISWEEALNTIAIRFKEIEEKYNDKDAILFATGTSRGWYISFVRFANALRRQFVSPGHAQCFWPRYSSQILQGIYPALECPDVYLHPEKTKCILVWGTNPPNTTPIRAARSLW